MRLLTGRIPKSGLPESVGQADDVFQSLAAFIRTAGVFENPGEFNAKFAWADYFRQRISLRPSCKSRLKASLYGLVRAENARVKIPGGVRDSVRGASGVGGLEKNFWRFWSQQGVSPRLF
jgi:hypothetical protein